MRAWVCVESIEIARKCRPRFVLMHKFTVTEEAELAHNCFEK